MERYIHVRVTVVHTNHGSVRTSVFGSRFGTGSVQRRVFKLNLIPAFESNVSFSWPKLKSVYSYYIVIIVIEVQQELKKTSVQRKLVEAPRQCERLPCTRALLLQLPSA